MGCPSCGGDLDEVEVSESVTRFDCPDCTARRGWLQRLVDFLGVHGIVTLVIALVVMLQVGLSMYANYDILVEQCTAADPCNLIG